MPPPKTNDSPLVLIGPSADKPLMQVSPLRSLPSNARKIDIANAGVNRLSPLLQPILSTVIAKEAANPQLMQVVINGPLAQAADGNGLRAFVREGGSITEHARLFEPEHLRSLVNSAAMFQIASMVVAQQHLADISLKLEEIKRGVQDIKEFQNEQRKSRITGAIKYLEPVIEAVRDGEDVARCLPVLEATGKDMGGIADHLVAEFRALSEKVRDYDEPGFFETTSPLTAKVQSAQKDAADRLSQWKVCMSVSWMALSIARRLEGDSTLHAARERQLREEVDAFFAPFGPLETFKAEVATRIDNLSSLRDSRSAIQINRIALRKLEDALPEQVRKTRNHIQEIKTLLLPREETVTLTIHMVEGRCVAAYQA